MPGELSHGLPWLAANGNKIVRADTGAPILLRGVNRSGLEYSAGPDGFLAAAGITGEEIREIVQGWGANIIRVPFNQDWALHGRNGFSAERYLTSLDQIVDWAAGLGAYTLLDLQWLDADNPFGHLQTGEKNFVAPLPNRATPDLWAMLARRYQFEPAVLFDIFNEPHNRLADDPYSLCLINEDGSFVDSDTNSVGPDEWCPWARKLINVIRTERRQSLIWVPGIDWAFDHRGVAPTLAGENSANLVYSTHVYPNRFRWLWRSHFGFVGDELPLFIGEYGGRDNDLDWGGRLASYIRKHACGWTAWSWSDDPRLVKDAQAGDLTPTQFGQFVRAEMGAAIEENRPSISS